MEKNHPGFNSDIKDPNQSQYKAFVQSLESKMQEDISDKYCLAYLKQYLRYLKDHHINIRASFQPVKEDSLADVERFFKSLTYLSTEKKQLDSTTIVTYLQSLSNPTIEGIYKTPDNVYTIALIKDQTNTRDYAGIILASATKLWQPGHIKFEIKQVNDSTLDVFMFLRNHSLEYNQLSYNKQNFQIPGWIKIFPQSSNQSTEKLSTDIFSFSLLDSNTAYISMRSFSGQYSTMLDSAYKAVMPEIQKRKYLIIDVRNNGGGSDGNYKALMPFIATGPVTHDVVDLYATPDNISAYQKMRDLYKSKPEVYGKNGFMSWQPHMEKMQKTQPFTFIPMMSDKPGVTRYKPHKGYPERVAIIYNRNCASACESLLFEARFSDKVVTVGENSGGYTGYGNVMDITTPCGRTLSWTTTRYRNQRQFDFTGIPPKHYVPESESNWIEYTQKLLSSF